MHEPKQKRSVETRNKILDVAYQLFCKNGYYKTTTNEIAQVADISIGNLYFYFKDKDTIFIEIIKRYNESFLQAHEEFYKELEKFRSDRKQWLYKLMENMIQIHENSKELNREIYILCFTNLEVEELMQKQQKQVDKTVSNYFRYFKDEIKIQDIEAASSIAYTLLNAVVDQIAWSKNKVERERLLAEAVNAIEKYLFY